MSPPRLESLSGLRIALTREAPDNAA